MGERVSGAHGGAYLRHQQAALARQLKDFPEGRFQIFLNVVAQGFQGRDVEDFGAVLQFASQGFAHEAIDTCQEGGQGLAGAGGRGDQGGSPGEDMRPALLLRLGGRAEARNKPVADEGVGPG